MTATDFILILQWWWIWLVLGLIFLPLTSSLFSKFFDRGFIFSKIVGILSLSYLAWLLGSLRILSFSTNNLFILSLILLVINLVIFYKSSLKLKTSLPFFILEESLFLVSLIAWAFVRAHEPSIHGLEKYMDYGFINSLLRSDYFPPKDLWMTPLSINYYYFGHLTAAVATKLSGIDSAVTYNLTLATLFALTLTSAFSIGGNLLYKFSPGSLRKIFISGTLSAFLVTLGGNLHTIYVFFQSYTPPENPVPFWQLPFSWNFLGYWYPNATRFIPFTIHEFPIYSFVVADLHGHVFDIPFVLLCIGFLIKLYFEQRFHWFDYLILGFLVSVFLMTNVLDGPIYLLLIWLVQLSWYPKGQNLSTFVIDQTRRTLVVLFWTIIFSLPFWLAFKPFGSGIGILCAPQFLTNLGHLGPLLFEANHCARSPLWMLGILWGFPLTITTVFVAYVLGHKIKKPLGLNRSDLLALILVAFSIILIIIPELVYVKDIYPAHYRANTVFKFGFEAFIILALTCSYMITRLSYKKVPRLVLLFCGAMFFLVAVYPQFAISSYYGNLQISKPLDGLLYLSELYPSDYQAILWLRQNIKGQPVILEGQGDSYTDFARVSANTGLPTVIGWPVHEWLWRGSYDEAGKRSGEVTQLYQDPNLDLTKSLIKKYHISYVFVGILERAKYSALQEDKFKTLGTIVYQNGSTVIYRINP